MTDQMTPPTPGLLVRRGHNDTTDPKFGEIPRHRPLPGGWQDRKDLAAIVEKYRAASEALKAALPGVAVADEKLAAAEAEDAQVTAAALIADKPDPGPKNVEAATIETADVRRRAIALHAATRDAARSVNDLFAATREAWRDEVRAERKATEEELAAKLEECLDLLAGVDAQTKHIRLLHPENKGRAIGTMYSQRPQVDGENSPERFVRLALAWLDQDWEGEQLHRPTAHERGLA